MAKVIEGYLITERYSKGETKHEPKSLGVVFNEYQIEEKIHDESEYYGDELLEYGRSIIDNGVMYYSKKRDETIEYRYEKCLVIVGV